MEITTTTANGKQLIFAFFICYSSTTGRSFLVSAAAGVTADLAAGVHSKP